MPTGARSAPSASDSQPWAFIVGRCGSRLVLGEPVTATTANSPTFSVVGSVLWSIGLLAVFFPLAMRRYRRG